MAQGEKTIPGTCCGDRHPQLLQLTQASLVLIMLGVDSPLIQNIFDQSAPCLLFWFRRIIIWPEQYCRHLLLMDLCYCQGLRRSVWGITPAKYHLAREKQEYCGCFHPGFPVP